MQRYKSMCNDLDRDIKEAAQKIKSDIASKKKPDLAVASMNMFDSKYSEKF